jgi:hypothetical protein
MHPLNVKMNLHYVYKDKIRTSYRILFQILTWLIPLFCNNKANHYIGRTQILVIINCSFYFLIHSMMMADWKPKHVHVPEFHTTK